MSKDIQEAIEKLKKPKKQDLIEVIRIFKRNEIENYCIVEKETIDTALNYIETLENKLENSIPVQVVKEKIEELKKEYEIALEENSTKAFILKCQISILQELLGDDK